MSHRLLVPVLVLVLASLLASPVAIARNEPKTGDVQEIVTQQQQIRRDLRSADGDYRGLSLADQAELARRQDELLRMLDGKQSTAELSPGDQMAAFNNLEWIEGLLNNAEEERLVCRRERVTGSNRLTSVCRTEAQMRSERERAREDMMNNPSRMQMRR